MPKTKMDGGAGTVGQIQGWIQVVEKRRTEDKNVVIIEELTKGNIEGKDFVRYDEWTFNGLCTGYRMIEVASSNLLEISEYHSCQEDYEDLVEDLDEYEESKSLRAYVETEDAGKVMAISSFEDFNRIYSILRECIAGQNGWGKTVRCELEKNGAAGI
jgi:hypothetical protein